MLNEYSPSELKAASRYQDESWFVNPPKMPSNYSLSSSGDVILYAWWITSAIVGSINLRDYVVDEIASSESERSLRVTASVSANDKCPAVFLPASS